MGNTKSKPNTLNNWWNRMRNEKILMNGPQIAFKLSKDNQTILLFGEHHKNSKECGTNEQFFLDLVGELSNSKKCDNISVILELENSGRGASRIIQIYNMIQRINNPQCIVSSFPANIMDINLRAVQLLNLKKYSDIELINEYENARQYLSNALDTIVYNNSIIHGTALYKSLSVDAHNIINPFMNSIQQRAKLCSHDLHSIHIKMPIEKLRESVICAFDVGRELIDLYTLIIILNKLDNIIVYEGSLHIIFIVAFLMKNANYELDDVAVMKEDNCISFDYRNITDGLKSIKEYKREDPVVADHFRRNLEIIEKCLSAQTSKSLVISENLKRFVICYNKEYFINI